ncbi:MAG: 16S rRNA (cytidine(1402)-2'-O)-methyltransferase [Leptospiraceae bacterium]|nr:16S rRNA (cytidine(1402)-2'-O)-methyltransferase [Leptospiraceae bacterium]MDW7975332.1 16S rRNA (cytidine(1402)-2'-O)-methyltransferase [Leptospiraceae bacterium]
MSLQKPGLYIISTPIGNLKDITLRALETLQECDVVLAEDTRKAKILFQTYKIDSPLKSFRIHQIRSDIEFAKNKLTEKKAVGFITDAGTPGISDPVSHLVRFVRENLPEVPIIPIPGPSALSTILSVSGWQTNPTLFLGFLSSKKTRRKQTLLEYKAFEGCIVIFESVHRVFELLEEVREVFPEREILIGREMTKKFENFYLFPPYQLDKSMIPPKGEFTILIAPSKEKKSSP